MENRWRRRAHPLSLQAPPPAPQALEGVRGRPRDGHRLLDLVSPVCEAM